VYAIYGAGRDEHKWIERLQGTEGPVTLALALKVYLHEEAARDCELYVTEWGCKPTPHRMSASASLCSNGYRERKGQEVLRNK
jgi:hypothetical protein